MAEKFCKKLMDAATKNGIDAAKAAFERVAKKTAKKTEEKEHER